MLDNVLGICITILSIQTHRLFDIVVLLATNIWLLKVVILILRWKVFILKAATNETTTLHLTICTTIVLENFNSNYQHFNKHDFLTKFSQNNYVIFSFFCKIAFNCFNNTVPRTPAYLCYFLYFSMMMWSTCYSSIWHCYYRCVQRSSPRQLVY